MSKRRRTSEEIDAALRAEPAYKELCELLSRQGDAQKSRLEEHLSQQCEVSHEPEETMNQDTKPPVTVRIMELRDGEGLSFEKVANRLNDEGYMTQAGGFFVAQRVRKRYIVAKKHQTSQTTQRGEVEPVPSTQGKVCETEQPCDILSGQEDARPVCESSQPCEGVAVHDDPANEAKLARADHSERGERNRVVNLAIVARSTGSERADDMQVANTAKLAKDDRSEQADDTGIANLGNVATAERAEQEDDMGKVAAKHAKSAKPEHSEPGDDTRLAKAAMVASKAGAEPTELERAKAAKLATFDEPASACEESQPCEHVAPVVTFCETCELSQGKIPVAILRELRDMVRQEITTMNAAKSAKVASDAPPPIPRVAGGRKFLGKRVTLSGTRIDANIFTAFEKERTESGLSASDLMQKILWGRYRVRLSFEE